MSAELAWALLVIAGLFEVAWAIGLKYTEGFTKPTATTLTVAAMVISMGLLGVVAKQLPIGTAYAVWTGIGVFGTAVLGVYLFGESMAPLRLLCLAFIITGIVGLKLTSG
jgi:quaternary ammonium compound-resistance protein SugE